MTEHDIDNLMTSAEKFASLQQVKELMGIVPRMALLEEKIVLIAETFEKLVIHINQLADAQNHNFGVIHTWMTEFDHKLERALERKLRWK